MIFTLIFILIWVAIIVLAKDKIKNKIKQLLNIKTKSSPKIIDSLIIKDIEREYNDLQNMLDMNVLSIRDELSNRKIIKVKTDLTTTMWDKPQEIKTIKEDIVELEDINTGLDINELLKKTWKILKKLIYDMLGKIQKYFK